MADDLKAIYEALLRAEAEGTSAVLATVIATQGSMPRHAGSKMLVWADGAIVGTVGGGALEARVIQEALAALADRQPRLRSYTLNSLDDGDPGLCGGTAQIFIEPLNVPPTLLVIGGGHVGRALAELGKWMSFRVALSDDREAFCNPAYAPGLDHYVVSRPAEITSNFVIDSQTYVAAVTRGLPVDLDLIPALLQTPAPYIGFIGSRRRWMLTMQAVTEKFQITDFSRIRAPIGLELQAETPKEIALSIMAEIVMARRGGTGLPMMWHGSEGQTHHDV